MKLSSKRGIQKHEIESSSSKGFDTDLSVKKPKKGKKLHSSSHSEEDMSIVVSTGGSKNVPAGSDLTPRERQYLFSAGLHPLQVKKKRKQSDTSSSAVTTTTTTSAEEFATRALGSSCPRTRHDAIQRLQLYLSTCAATKGISYLDIKKLWKGMWYGLYMCDKVVVQDELSSHMAQLIWSVAGTIEGDMKEAQHYVNLEELALEEDKDDEDNSDDDDVPMDEDDWDRQPGELTHAASDEEEVLTSSSNEEECESKDGNEEDFDNDKHPHHTSVHLVCLFLKGYFETIHREWGKMDKHRIDKFYRSMRLMLSEVFQYCATREWHIGIIHMLNDVVFNEILCCDEEAIMLKYPNGVRFHLIDILLDEVVKASNGITGDTNHDNDSHVPIGTIEFLAVLEPYLTIAMADSDKIVQARVVENILQKFISQYSILSVTQNDDENTTPLLLHDVNVQSVAEQIFDVASNVDTADRYRSSLYQMHKLYVRKIKEAKAISGCTTHCKESYGKETTTFAVPSNDMDHDTEEEISVHEEETKEESTSERQEHKKQHKKKQKKRKSSASDVCENQSTQTNHTASNGKKTTVQSGNGDKGKSSIGAAINTAPAAENILHDVTPTMVGTDSDTKRSKKRKNDATDKDRSERNDYAEIQKNQSLGKIQLTTAIVNNSQQKRVEREIQDKANSKKSRRQSMDDKKQRKDDKSVKLVEMHDEGVVLSKKMSIDHTIRKKDDMDVESEGGKQAGSIDPLPVKDTPCLIAKKKRNKDDANVVKIEVNQGKTDNVVPSRTSVDKKTRAKENTTKFVEEKTDATSLKNTSPLMNERKHNKDGAGKKSKGLTSDDNKNAEALKNKALSANDKNGLNKVGEKQKEEDVNVVTSKNKPQSMDHKKVMKADITSVNSVDSASLPKKAQLMDDKKKPVDKNTGFANVASDSAATAKKHKEKQNQLSNLDFTAASKELDDEIVISLREQSDYLRNAVNSINSSQKKQKSKTSTTSVPPLTKKQQSAIDDAVEKERQRRVKFGYMNRSKSYKASMTALQTMQHPTTATREPEKPILREPKYTSSPVPIKDKSKNRYVSAQGQPKK